MTYYSINPANWPCPVCGKELIPGNCTCSEEEVRMASRETVPPTQGDRPEPDRRQTGQTTEGHPSFVNVDWYPSGTNHTARASVPYTLDPAVEGMPGVGRTDRR